MSESASENRPKTITWDDTAKDCVLTALGIETRGSDDLWKDDKALWSPSGRRVTYENVAGFVEYQGRFAAVTDDFNDLVAIVKDRHHRDVHTDQEGDRDV